MSRNYRIILSNHSVYKEIEIPSGRTAFVVGNTPGSGIRLRRELFFESLELHFDPLGEGWMVSGSDNLYLDTGNGLKRVSLALCHGTQAGICYRATENEALHLEFYIDFDSGIKSYDRQIDVRCAARVSIGGSETADIILHDEYIGEGIIVLVRNNDGWLLQKDGTEYGVNVNGTRKACGILIREGDFFSIAAVSFYYRDGYLYTAKGETIRVRGLPEKCREEPATVFSYPRFIRSTRIRYQLPKEAIEIQQPSPRPSLTKKSLLMSLIPALVMLAMTIVLRGIIGGGGTYVIYSAVSMGMGAVLSVITYFQDKKANQKDLQTREEDYRTYIAQKEDLIIRSRSNELRIRRLIQEPLEYSLDEVEHFGKRLFEKAPDDPDFLLLYLGDGTVPSANPVQTSQQEFVDPSDPISMLPEQLAERYRTIENAPVYADLNASGAIGITGGRENLGKMLRVLTLDLAIRHFYKDVKLVFLLNPSYVQEFAWVRWLQNVYNEAMDIRNIGCDEESIGILLEFLYSVLSGREAFMEDGEEKKEQAVLVPHYVVVVTDPAMIGVYPVSRYFGRSAKYGVTFLFLDEHEENIPRGCDAMIRLYGGNCGEILQASDGDGTQRFCRPEVSEKEAEAAARRLGAIRVDEVSLEAGLTANITMFELLGILSAEDLDLKKRWGESRVYQSMAVPIGVRGRGEQVSLNLSDKADAHGPHGLVAGTTGSGKSEILQTYILSAAVSFHPYDISFVIIDFKGGGMANQFAALPHLIGTITNIDGREIDRSLLSIKAELVKRQEMFSRAGVNHINDYIRMYKQGNGMQPIPHLVIIVDEFAELKAEYPDFMKELISAARIGRTLGVHLILATQKPAGVVDAQIWSNSKFRLCLKVQSREDSNEVLKSPLAAEIVEPGRAYFQVGNNEIFELIQSAYSGAPIPEGNDSKETIFSIYERNLWGKKTQIYSNKRKKKERSTVSQLDAIVLHVQQYCRDNHIEKLPGICLPPLPEGFSTEDMDYVVQAGEIRVPIGIYDDPEQQRQGIVRLDLVRNNVFIVGTSQMGKTILLQTIAYGLVRLYTPQQVSLYAVDCGSMMLKNFEEAYHTGGVVVSNEEEKCRNLFRLLEAFVRERKKLLSGKGVGNYAAYLEAGFKDLPLAVIMIDNMAAFRELYPEQAEKLVSLTREAVGVGLSFIITAASSNALNYRIRANFGENIVLSCNDASEYSNVFGRCHKTPRETAGRCLIMRDKRILEMQTAMYGLGKKEAERSDGLRQFIRENNASLTGRAKSIPMVPDHLILGDVLQEHAAVFRCGFRIPVGMAFSTVDFHMLDLVGESSLALLGDAKARTAFLQVFLSMLNRTIVFHNIRAAVVDDRKRALAAAQDYGFVEKYTSDTAEGLEILSDFAGSAQEECCGEEDGRNETKELKLLVLNHEQVFRQALADKVLSRELAGALRSAEGSHVFYLFGTIDNQPAAFGSSEILKLLKELRQGILFAPLSDNRFYEISGRVKQETDFDAAMGYCFCGSVCMKLRLFENAADSGQVPADHGGKEAGLDFRKD